MALYVDTFRLAVSISCGLGPVFANLHAARRVARSYAELGHLRAQKTRFFRLVKPGGNRVAVAR
jgi:hypothetical protein